MPPIPFSFSKASPSFPERSRKAASQRLREAAGGEPARWLFAAQRLQSHAGGIFPFPRLRPP
ncbi:hypothetical protein CLOLEP_02594 [[Clostridium] leptum DSM 753]|uniref:Uncharacterized protein n=1 Tax=[Clostridium] leptum DSM 753 TaxID=428125 RepID=A7VVI2_9FIRM|nr:hypothetical protein CLOLEP_02594 [[Clostridium] leptum DSM 753]